MQRKSSILRQLAAATTAVALTALLAACGASEPEPTVTPVVEPTATTQATPDAEPSPEPTTQAPMQNAPKAGDWLSEEPTNLPDDLVTYHSAGDKWVVVKKPAADVPQLDVTTGRVHDDVKLAIDLALYEQAELYLFPAFERRDAEHFAATGRHIVVVYPAQFGYTNSWGGAYDAAGTLIEAHTTGPMNGGVEAVQPRILDYLSQAGQDVSTRDIIAINELSTRYTGM